jgi:hypothetical protein
MVTLATCINMGILLWLLAAVGVLGTPSPLPAMKAFLVSVDGSLPLLSPVDSKICYLFDLTQSCSGEAIGHILNLPSSADVFPWSADTTSCDALLDAERFYMEAVASSVFSEAIASAASAGVTNFELMVQSWVLRVGHYPLTQTHAAFVAALNSISDWKQVKCEETDLLYDSTTIPKPDFLGSVDCDVLGAVYVPPIDCSNFGCSLDAGASCCVSNVMSVCCGARLGTLNTYCSTAGCPYRDFCCSAAFGSACCTPSR